MKAACLLTLGLGCSLLAEDAPRAKPESKTPEPQPAAGIYDANPQHLWNRLHTAFYQREVETIDQQKVVPMGPEILDPPLGIHPRYLLDEKPFAASNAILDEFLVASAEIAAAGPLKRALLQRDLWAVFDLLQAEVDSGLRNFGDTPPWAAEHQERRAILSRKLARAITALALPRTQLEALPHTYALAVQSGSLAVAPASQERADYLPRDLFAEKSPWLEATPAKPFLHTMIVGRSVFRIFFRPPDEPDGAAKFAKWVQEFRRVQALGEDPSDAKWQPLEMGTPLGSRFLLLREMVSIDDRGNLVPTHVVESVQVRVFREAPPRPPGAAADDLDLAAGNQLFEEFELDRRQLLRGEAGGLKPTPKGAPRLMGYTGLGSLAVNRQGLAMMPDPFPRNCFVCHVRFEAEKGELRAPRLGSLGRASKLSPPPWDDTAAQTTLRWKSEQYDFRRLLEMAKREEQRSGK
jgi:hypothetical protein